MFYILTSEHKQTRKEPRLLSLDTWRAYTHCTINQMYKEFSKNLPNSQRGTPRTILLIISLFNKTSPGGTSRQCHDWGMVVFNIPVLIQNKIDMSLLSSVGTTYFLNWFFTWMYLFLSSFLAHQALSWVDVFTLLSRPCIAVWNLQKYTNMF